MNSCSPIEIRGIKNGISHEIPHETDWIIAIPKIITICHFPDLKKLKSTEMYSKSTRIDLCAEISRANVLIIPANGTLSMMFESHRHREPGIEAVVTD